MSKNKKKKENTTMKKQLSLAMAGVMALSLAACGGSSASSAANLYR